MEMREENGRKPGDVRQFVCFRLANEEYALDINYVQEVIRVHPITPVPQMPRFCLGVINIRGQVVSVFDLCKLFHLPEKPMDSITKILVATIDNVTISMVVDEILENIKFDESHIDPAPSVKMNVSRECIQGIGELDGRMIVIMDLPRIHETILGILQQKEVAV